MAHFAEIDENNIVIRVLVVPNDQEHRGQEYLAEDLHLGGTWIQTSYNTKGNKHLLGGTPMHGHYAGIGWEWLPEEKLFIEEKPFPSWVIDTEIGTYVAPVAYNESEHEGFLWNEDEQNWTKPSEVHSSWVWSDELKGWVPPVEHPTSEDETMYEFDNDSQTWVVV
tara:strand:- start:916 stop:1413 length:498 start_codon:yes stop_codon:yes gene_type:complete